MLLAALVHHLRALSRFDPRQRLWQQVVQRHSAQAAAQHQQAQRAAAIPAHRRGSKNVVAHRVAGTATVCTVGEAAGKTFAATLGKTGQQTVGGADHSILLMDDQRNTAQPGCQPARTGNIAASAKHANGLERAKQAQRLAQRPQNTERRLEQVELALAAQALNINVMDREAGLRHQIHLNAPARTKPVHFVALITQHAGTSQRRENVPAGAARHDQYLVTHGRPLVPPGDAPSQSAAADRGKHSTPPASCRRN